MEQADERAAPETGKRGRGNPNMRPGASSVNPSGKPKSDNQGALSAAQREIEELRAELAKREEKAAKVRVVELEARVADLEAQLAAREPEKDEGSERAIALCDRLLEEFGVDPVKAGGL